MLTAGSAERSLVKFPIAVLTIIALSQSQITGEEFL
jgi:hypothetical protein